MNPIASQKCFNHPEREAAARCPECARFYCRECITEHEDRVLCAVCLSKRLAQRSSRAGRFGVVARFFQAGLGVWITWMFFYYLGRVLLNIPSSFHDADIWKKAWF